MPERFIEIEHQDGTRSVARFFSNSPAEIPADAVADYLDDDDLREFEADLREGW